LLTEKKKKKKKKKKKNTHTGHFNPAVTVGTLCAGRITVLRCIGYVFAQLLGATTGAGIMIGAIPGALEGDYMGVPQCVRLAFFLKKMLFS
jgi:glycerol uptake facilitator-like aquaporin